jgi:CheY-like chemotaxis protein
MPALDRGGRPTQPAAWEHERGQFHSKITANHSRLGGGWGLPFLKSFSSVSRGCCCRGATEPGVHGGERMTDELLSLRILVVCGSRSAQGLFRQAAAASTVPIEIIEADGITFSGRSVRSGIDLAFLDAELGSEVVAQVTALARAAIKPPFTVLLCPPGPITPFQTDALAAKPLDSEDAVRLLRASIRVRLMSRIMVVDDSATMRGIVRRILTATRFPLEVTEVEKGGDAIELAGKHDFDIVFLDYHMPGFSGLETITEFRRLAKKQMMVVLMTSDRDETLVLRARAQGATFLKKPFFPADIEAVLCRFYGLRALNMKRA